MLPRGMGPEGAPRQLSSVQISAPLRWPTVGALGDESRVINSISSEHPAISLRTGYNIAEPAAVVLPWPDAIFLDIDGVQSGVANFDEMVAQTFLARYGVVKSLEDLREEKNRHGELWRYSIALAMLQPASQAALLQGDITPDGFDRRCRDELRSVERIDHGHARNLAIVAHNALRMLRQHWPLVAITNRNFDDALDFLDQSDLLQHYEVGDHLAVHGRTDTVRTKPHADMAVRAKKQLENSGVSVRHAIMVGDSPTDLREFSVAAAHHQLDQIPVAVLAPGRGYDLALEVQLLESHGAVAAYPTLNHLAKDLMRAVDLAHGDMELPRYREMKGYMREFQASLERYMAGQDAPGTAHLSSPIPDESGS